MQSLFGASTADFGRKFQFWNAHCENIYFLMSSLLGVLYNIFFSKWNQHNLDLASLTMYKLTCSRRVDQNVKEKKCIIRPF